MLARSLHSIRRQWMGALALFLVLTGGVAYGANTVFSTDIVNGEVKTEDIGPGAVTVSDIGPESVRTEKVLDESLTGADIKNGTVRGGDVLNNSVTGGDIDETTLSGGGDVSGPLSNLQLGRGTVSRNELASGGPNMVFSDFEYSIPAKSCHTRSLGTNGEADLGEIAISFPESADLGSGVYLRPTVVAHDDEMMFEICNDNTSAVTIPFGTFFQIRLIG